MSAEHLHGNHERSEDQERAQKHLERERTHKLDSLGRRPEHEQDAEKRAETARQTIEKQELAPTPAPAPETAPENEAAPKPTHLHHLNPKLNYIQTLAAVQQKLAPASRSFSRVIHTPAVEKTSEALEKTVARPSVVLGATWTALIIGSVFYFLAHHYGYALSGSEMILSFAAGAVIGVVLESFWRIAKRR